MEKRKSCYFLIRNLIWVLGVVYACTLSFCGNVQAKSSVVFPVSGDSDPEKVVSSVSSRTNAEYLPVSEGENIEHTYFRLSFNDEHKQANWVYYKLELTEEGGLTERTNNFREDKKVRNGSAKPSDYAKSGYDRGHLCPAGDMTQSIEAMSETFYMSNMSPQVPAFNRGIWKTLEEKVRNWGKKEPLFIATGPVFKDMKGCIGKSRVTVPGYYYKVVYSSGKQQMIAFVLPNRKGEYSLPHYVVSVDSVETLTGIDFFSQLSDTLENRLEACSFYQKWE